MRLQEVPLRNDQLFGGDTRCRATLKERNARVSEEPRHIEQNVWEPQNARPAFGAIVDWPGTKSALAAFDGATSEWNLLMKIRDGTKLQLLGRNCDADQVGRQK